MQVALDATRVSAVASLIPADVCERLMRETARRDAWDVIRHPLRTIQGATLILRFLIPKIVQRSRRGGHRREDEVRERPPADIIRAVFAAAWVQAIMTALDRAGGAPVALGNDLFPSEFPNDVLGFDSLRSWCDVIAQQCNDFDDRAVAGLMDAFALRARELITAQGAIDLPNGIFVRKEPTKYGGYLAERRSA